MTTEVTSADWRYRIVADTGNLFWALQLAGWFGLSVITYVSLSLPYNQFELSYLAHNIGQSILGIFLTLPLRYLYRAIWGWPVWRRVLTAIGAALLFAICWAVLRLLMFMAMTGETGVWADFGGWSYPSIFVFVTWAALYHGIKYYQLLQREREMLLEYEARQRREAMDMIIAKSETRDAQLKLLRYQLNPHFLFNTLNSVMALITGARQEDAKSMLAKLSAFLRFSLESDGKYVVPVEEECAALELYLDIERVRFVDRLSVEFDIDPEVTRLAVPSFLLQPLVENSIKHAIGKSEAGGTIRISASASDKMIRIAVEDSGSGDPDQDLQSSAEDGPEGTGVGLRNTRERLKNLYGDRSTVELARSMLGGLRINISIPAVEVLQYD
jgi:sensor histidine kinase YesM